MSVYMTEEEQLEAIKKWWNKNSNIITYALSILLLAFAGYKYWNWHEEKTKVQASIAYEQLMNAFSNQDNKRIQSYANQLISDYPKTVYADAAHLTLAKFYVSDENLIKAKEELSCVARSASMPVLKQIATLRLVRLLTAEKQYDKALAELQRVEDNAYMPLINELKGDIYAATGKYQEAVASYKKAINEVHTTGIGNPFLEMKTNELAALTQSTNLNANVPQAA